jgi:O-acetyl-ADP-ribose deacetylase (regulator of RNase III)
MTAPTKFVNLHEYEGDLLKASVSTIAHQCNVMSNKASGLAAVIFEMVPESDVYASNPNPLRFGTWDVFPVENMPFKNVLNLYTQMYPGKPQWGADSALNRLKVFRDAVNMYLATHVGVVGSIAFPKYIGCGLAGGNWYNYRKVIQDISELHPYVEFHIIEKSS